MNVSETKEKRIIIEFRLTRNKLLAMFTALFVMWFPRILGSETLQLTTYYPAPYGGYARLLTTDLTALATQSGSVGIGTREPLQKLDVRGKVYISDNVGIGTTNPTEKLVVEGGNVTIGAGTVVPVGGIATGWLRAMGLQGMCTLKPYTENKTPGDPSDLTSTCGSGYIAMGYANVSSINVRSYVFLTPTSGYQGLRFIDNVAGDMVCCKIKKDD